MIKYMHVERLGNDDVDGILNGTVYIQPKIDGANGQVFYDQDRGELICASRKLELNSENTNQGFWNYIQQSTITNKLFEYFGRHPYHILYGEWLIPHTLKTYREDAWRKFYVFDVFDSYSQMFLDYDKYIERLISVEIPFIPVIAKLFNPKEEDLNKFLTQNTFLIDDGKGSGEGIVIKNYNFINKYGRTTWAKLVRNEFKEEHVVAMGYAINESYPLELKITDEFITLGRLEKVKSKMLDDSPWNDKRIPEYFSRVWFELITEEMWNILKKYKNPKIDFKSFYNFIVYKIKELDKEIFK